MSTDQINETAVPSPLIEEVTTENRRAKLLVIGVGLLAVLGAAAYFLLFAGGDAQPTPAPAPPPAAAAPAPAEPAPPVPPVFNGNTGTDPFKPLVTEPEPAAAAPAAGTDGSTTDSGTTSGTGTSQVLGVVSVTDDNSLVSVTVDGTSYPNLAVGQTFATFYKVYGIFGGTCAGFLFGDQSIGGCVGDTLTVNR